jgi:hypothetical protein
MKRDQRNPESGIAWPLWTHLGITSLAILTSCVKRRAENQLELVGREGVALVAFRNLIW